MILTCQGFYEKTLFICRLPNKDNGFKCYYYTNKLNSDYSVTKDDIEIINDYGITPDCYKWYITQNEEVFIKQDIFTDDIKRMYIISQDYELIQIYNNLGNDSWQFINTEFISDIINRKPIDVYKL